MKKLTQTTIDLYDTSQGTLKGFGPLGLEQNQVPENVFAIFISSAIGIIGIIAMIWFIFIIVTSGIAYMSAGADQKATEGARKKIGNGLVGLLVTIFGIFIIRLIGQIFNLPNILSIGKLIEQARAINMKTHLLAGSGSGDIGNPLFSGTNFDALSQVSTGGERFLGLILPKFVGVLLVFGSLAFFFMFLWGAVSWIISGGDKAHVEAAKNRITNALIGFVLMIAVFAIARLIKTFFGLDILSIDIGPLVIQ